MTTSAVMLAAIAVSQMTGADPAALSAAGAWAAPPVGCAVTQVHLTPSLLYSAESQGYVVSAITFDEVPSGCVGQGYHLALVAADGVPVFEVTGEMGETNREVSVPSADRPRADVVATTVLTMTADGSALLSGMA